MSVLDRLLKLDSSLCRITRVIVHITTPQKWKSQLMHVRIGQVVDPSVDVRITKVMAITLTGISLLEAVSSLSRFYVPSMERPHCPQVN